MRVQVLYCGYAPALLEAQVALEARDQRHSSLPPARHARPVKVWDAGNPLKRRAYANNPARGGSSPSPNLKRITQRSPAAPPSDYFNSDRKIAGCGGFRREQRMTDSAL